MELIKENNHKRDFLNAENEKIYEDLLLYIRTDLRVNEQAAEELLMDLLDHLIEAQENGKAAADLFGDSPETYADELIANMPNEDKRNLMLLFASGILGLVGWFAVSYGIINAAISIFTSVENDFALGSGLMILVALILVGVIGVFFIFRIIRSTVFKPANQEWKIYVYSGLFSMAAFAFVLGIGFFFDGIGPVIHIQWWLFIVIGLALLGINKGMSRLSANQ
ncbi:DUF1129 family protein [Microbacterium sp. APC 3898]|uniref:DUF1129 family protein n=1 Tax=Planococcus notacanthi TaxID=3035188 RepID=A0ABT7ZG47_9BACL|nr:MULTISPECIES: DUF1129 family protein [Terrabacteria group]MDN3426099.1 DUF1129 family protein [Planococcus sp. APC 4016]MDN3437693.1 DUF1129 family protein [Planococcus sp. APC 3900]MDN3497796.1 DUF1129 family protein [Microbacterium sp. APC 3898]